MGKEEEEWLEDDENLSKWENNELTASDRRILIGQWYVKAFKKACEGEAKRKYFEHTGGLLTADGSGDALLKLEGKPIGEVFGWDDTPVDVEEAELGAGEVEPPDIAPQRVLAQREGEDPAAQNFVDDEDESDVDDVPPAPREAPPGFKNADEPPSAEQLAFSKEKEAPGDALVGKSILYNWPVVGWCVGQVVERNTDGRSFKTIDGERVKVNFLIFYEIDQQTVKTVLRLDDYGSEWVLLASLEATVPIEPGPA